MVPTEGAPKIGEKRDKCTNVQNFAWGNLRKYLPYRLEIFGQFCIAGLGTYRLYKVWNFKNPSSVGVLKLGEKFKKWQIFEPVHSRKMIIGIWRERCKTFSQYYSMALAALGSHLCSPYGGIFFQKIFLSKYCDAIYRWKGNFNLIQVRIVIMVIICTVPLEGTFSIK